MALACAKLRRMTTGIERPRQAETEIQPPKFTDSQRELIQGFVDGSTENYAYESLQEDLVAAMEEKSKRLAAIKAIKLGVRFNLVKTENLNPPKEPLTDRQLKILVCTHRGLSITQTAKELDLQIGSVGYMRSATFKKIGVKHFLQASGWVEKFYREILQRE